MFEDGTSFINSITNLVTIDDKVNVVIESYESKTNVELEDIKRVASILKKS